MVRRRLPPPPPCSPSRSSPPPPARPRSEHKAGVDPCDRCGDAVEPAHMEEHRRQWYCKPLPPVDVGNRCPLCHKDIPPEKEGWLGHLIGAGCAQNQRTFAKAAAAARGGS